MTTTTVEGIEVDRALLDELVAIADRIDALTPELRELLDRAFRVYGKVLAAAVRTATDVGDDDDRDERFRKATGARRVEDFLYAAHDWTDHDRRLFDDCPEYSDAIDADHRQRETRSRA